MKDLSVGDDVQWMHVSRSGRALKFSQRYGVLMRISGRVGIVQSRNGRTMNVLLSDLRRLGEKGHVTQMFEGLAKASVS